jgi:hypothetical protein
MHEEPASTHEACFHEAIGEVLQKAWISPERRGKRVRKPLNLGLKSPYIRTERMTIRASILLCQPFVGDENSKVVRFEEKGGILTALLHTGGEDSFGVNAFVSMTKFEVGCILQGYPPFFKEYVRLTNEDRARSPLRSKQDGSRGG